MGWVGGGRFGWDANPAEDEGRKRGGSRSGEGRVIRLIEARPVFACLQGVGC